MGQKYRINLFNTTFRVESNGTNHKNLLGELRSIAEMRIKHADLNEKIWIVCAKHLHKVTLRATKCNRGTTKLQMPTKYATNAVAGFCQELSFAQQVIIRYITPVKS